ncbi:hypothetical protein AB0I53_41260 [Saccharopolyspora sp. NPDC050389]|uniref:hypothetical protein n=1 Tax=Saccharopolyspora sp. NPDC050389 TaxID=3155516 RepID=UPI0033FCED19
MLGRRGFAAMAVAVGCFIAGCGPDGPAPLDRVKADLQATQSAGSTTLQFASTSAGADLHCEGTDDDGKTFYGTTRARATTEATNVRPEQARQYLDAVEALWRDRSNWLDHDRSTPEIAEMVYVSVDRSNEYLIKVRYDPNAEQVSASAEYTCQ